MGGSPDNALPAGAARTAAADAGPPAGAAPPAATPPPPPPKEDPWEVNKPVERRTSALNEEARDCLFCFWSWITCGGPGARVRQLYVNGKLSRCMDDWTRLRNCMVMKMDPEKEVMLIPGPHPLWRIRSRKQAAEFWQVCGGVGGWEGWRHKGDLGMWAPGAQPRPLSWRRPRGWRMGLRSSACTGARREPRARDDQPCVATPL